MRRFIYAMVIVTLLILAAMPTVAQSIVVSNDEWIFADGYINNVNVVGTNDAQFATNSVQWMTGGPGGTIYILVTSEVGATYNTLASNLTALGYTVIGPTNRVPTLAHLQTYKAIYLASCDSDPNCPGLDFLGSGFTGYTGLGGFDTALVNYVQQTNNPGNVFILAGTTCHDARLWNPFLNTFGLTLVDACNTLSGIYNVVPFQTQAPYGQPLFAGPSYPSSAVNTVYIDIGNNVQSLNPDCGVQIFNDPNGNGLYGAWMPCCYQTVPRRLANRSVKPSVMPTAAQGRQVRSSLSAPPPPGLEIYDNGPVNGNINAWTINFGYSVTDSLEIIGPASGNMTEIQFWAWLFPGDVMSTLEVAVGTAPFDGSLLDATVGVTQSDCTPNVCGYNVCLETSVLGGPYSLGCYGCTAKYWVTLQNASVASGDPVFWDENYGVGCGGYLGTSPSTCPSSAFSSSTIGPIPSEAFTLQ